MQNVKQHRLHRIGVMLNSDVTDKDGDKNEDTAQDRHTEQYACRRAEEYFVLLKREKSVTNLND